MSAAIAFVEGPLLDWLAVRSVEVILLAALVGLTIRLGRRVLAPRWAYALWLLVPLRLAMPVSPATPVSVYGVLPDWKQTASATTPVVPADYPDLDAFTRSAVPAAAPPEAPGPGARSETKSSNGRTLVPAALLPPAAIPEPAFEAPVAGTAFPWRGLLGGIWLTGALGLAGLFVLRSTRFARALRDETVLREGPAADALLACAAESGVGRRIDLVVTDLVDTPAVHGAWRPRVLMPRRLLGELSPDELRLVLHHELAHVRCRDGVVNWALALVRSVFWFHPVVAWALRRLDAERETARDWMALAATGGGDVAAAQDYGHVLLRVLDVRRATPSTPTAQGAVALLEDRNDLKRRITMLANFRPATRRGLLLGGVILAALGCATLTSDPAAPAFAQEKSDPADGGETIGKTESVGVTVEGPAGVSNAPLRRVRVVRQRKVPQWETALRGKLASTFDVDFDGNVAGALSLLRKRTGANVVVHPDYREAALARDVRIKANALSGERFLTWALRAARLTWCPADGAVFVAGLGDLPRTHERRYYDARTLLREAADPPEDPDDEIYLPNGELTDLVTMLIAPESWEEEFASIEPWNGLLIVDATPQVHEGVEGLLNLLLNRGRRPAIPAPAWKRAVDERLARPVDFAVENLTARAAADRLAEATGLTIAVPEGYDDDDDVTIELSDVPGRQALNWLSRFAGLHPVPRDGGIALQEQPPMVYRCYAVRDVLERDLGGRDAIDDLISLIQSSAGGESWHEFEGPGIYRWSDFLVISQSEPVHGEIEQVLAALRNVFRTD